MIEIDEFRPLPIEDIRKNPYYYDWYRICDILLTEDFIREFQDHVIWGNICFRQFLSEEFLEEFQDKIKWKIISGYQKLSENFIRKYENELDWWAISFTQKLSKEFIVEFADKLSFHSGLKMRKLLSLMV